MADDLVIITVIIKHIYLYHTYKRDIIIILLLTNIMDGRERLRT